MIANLMTTLIMALGVATGNVSSNSYKGGNAFNNEKKIEAIELEQPQPKKAVDEETTGEWENIWQITTQNTISSAPLQIFTKYQVDYNAPAYTIHANAYRLSNYMRAVPNTSPQQYQVIANQVQIIQLTPYMNLVDGNNRLSLSTEVYYGTPNINYDVEETIYNTNSDYSQYLGLTNPNANTLYEELLTEFENDEKIIDQSQRTRTLNNDQTINNEIGYSFENETQFIIYLIQCYFTTTAVQNTITMHTIPNNFTIVASYNSPNYEVVDVPNLMFTILTLPFAWYSTAFNLTIFPGTPYQLNFGNIVLTIVAALILLYLIKKVIK